MYNEYEGYGLRQYGNFSFVTLDTGNEISIKIDFINNNQTRPITNVDNNDTTVPWPAPQFIHYEYRYDKSSGVLLNQQNNFLLEFYIDRGVHTKPDENIEHYLFSNNVEIIQVLTDIDNVRSIEKSSIPRVDYLWFSSLLIMMIIQQFMRKRERTIFFRNEIR